MNKIEEKLIEPFAVRILKSFYARTPQSAKSVIIGIGLFLGAFVTYVETNPGKVPEKMQKYVPGFCFLSAIILQTLSVKKPSADMVGEMDMDISDTEAQTPAKPGISEKLKNVGI